MNHNNIAAIITTYRPDEDFFKRIHKIINYCNYTIIVDNTPGGHAFINVPERVIILKDGINKGLGAALNLGINEAKALKIETVFLFDQDSSPDEFVLQGLYLGLTDSNDSRIIVGPTHRDDQSGEAKHRRFGNHTTPYLCTCLPTSGITLNMAELEGEDVFSETQFLDFVDFEWCWRLVSKGWRIYKLPNVIMPHRLGLAERKFAGLTYHVPAPYRHYFQFRDTLGLLPLSYVPIWSKIRLSVLLPIKILIYPIILDRGTERLKWMILGIRDAVLSVTGVGAASKVLK